MRSTRSTSVSTEFNEALALGRSLLLRQAEEAPQSHIQVSRQRYLETRAAFNWLAENRLLVKQTDKNLGTVIVSADWYKAQCCEFLDSFDFFREIDEREARHIYKKKVAALQKLAEHPCSVATPKLSEFLVSEIDGDGQILDVHVKVPIFSGLPKIHKKIWKVRPIIPCHSVPQGPASEYLSKILKGFYSEFSTILVSSKQLVIELEKLNVDLRRRAFPQLASGKKLFLCTGDITSFYTNVPIKSARQRINFLAWKKYAHLERGFKIIEFILSLFDAQQNDLVFKVVLDGLVKWMLQSDGLAMGVSAAPDIANLYAAYHEKYLTTDEFKEIVLFYKRYIDDIICLIWANNQNEAEKFLRENVTLPQLEINWEVSESSCVFLDLNIWTSNVWPGIELRYKPYRKPFNNFERLPYVTGHPDKMLRAAFKSEVHRMATLSYSVDVYASQLIWIADLYIERGYPAKVVLGWIKRFKNDAWYRRLRVTTSGEDNKDDQEDTNGIYPLLSIMNPVWEYIVLSDVHDAMVTHLVDLLVNPTVIRMSVKRLVASLRRPRNLTDFANAHNNRINGKSKDTDVLQVTGHIEPAPAEDHAEYAPANLDDHDWQEYWNILDPHAGSDVDMDMSE